MKKILSLTLAALMLVSMIPTVYAIDVDYLCPNEDCAAYGSSNFIEPCSSCAQMTYCSRCGYCLPCDTSDGEGSTIPEVGTTTVTLVGSETKSYYEVVIPAAIAPGGSADITVEGNWKSTETLKVSAPDKVTLYYGDQSIDVAIDFEDIAQVGNDKTDSSATSTLTLADASVKFGTWTGVIEYDVTLE